MHPALYLSDHVCRVQPHCHHSNGFQAGPRNTSRQSNGRYRKASDLWLGWGPGLFVRAEPRHSMTAREVKFSDAMSSMHPRKSYAAGVLD